MRIAVSIDEDKGLASVVSHHFGRCPHYLLADVEQTEIRDVTTVANPFFAQHQPGQVPGFINEQGVQVMITGGMGRRAIAFFQQYGIEPVTGAFGTVQQVLDQYLKRWTAGRPAMPRKHRARPTWASSPSSAFGWKL